MAEGKLKALVVDDDPLVLELVERSISRYGFDVTTTRAALGVANLIRTTQPDIVLLDVNIPALSGDRILSVVRQFAGPQTLFILYSSMDESKLRELMRTAGADGYIPKSVSGPELALKLSGMHHKHMASRPVVASQGSSSQASATSG
ncbi:response regulator [Corallococcus llansteffanensis]|uniref:Response regulator n=1 Tax=Corallococcus llansteffanensis TaxID=2316731 RepID=A0A3A8PEV1_9BACT|nr:response regulator [Corallococcus llansteffanensis]RKH54907.1 response regulator [Corallococcus llansteffanensis]